MQLKQMNDKFPLLLKILVSSRENNEEKKNFIFPLSIKFPNFKFENFELLINKLYTKNYYSI